MRLKNYALCYPISNICHAVAKFIAEKCFSKIMSMRMKKSLKKFYGNSNNSVDDFYLKSCLYERLKNQLIDRVYQVNEVCQ